MNNTRLTNAESPPLAWEPVGSQAGLNKLPFRISDITAPLPALNPGSYHWRKSFNPGKNIIITATAPATIGTNNRYLFRPKN